jgi:hypothetical protein
MAWPGLAWPDLPCHDLPCSALTSPAELSAKYPSKAYAPFLTSSFAFHQLLCQFPRRVSHIHLCSSGAQEGLGFNQKLQRRWFPETSLQGLTYSEEDVSLLLRPHA